MEAIKIKKKLFISLFVVVFSLSIVVGLAFAKGSVKIVVNGQQVTSDVAPQIVNNRVMVPLSVVAKALDANVGWNQKNQTVTINDKAIPSQEDIWKQDLDFIGSGWASLRNIIGTFMIGFDERDDTLIKSVTVEGYDKLPIGGMYPAIIDYKIVDAQELTHSLKVRVKVILYEDILKGEMWDFVITNRKIETMKKVDFFNVDEYTVFPGLSYSK